MLPAVAVANKLVARQAGFIGSGCHFGSHCEKIYYNKYIYYVCVRARSLVQVRTALNMRTGEPINTIYLV